MEEGEKLLWKSKAEDSSTMVSVTLGRVMNTLLSARPRKLNVAVSRLSFSDLGTNPSAGSLEEALWFLHKYVKDAAEKDVSLDDIVVPMLENSLRSRDVKQSHGGQSMILINWLFQDVILFQALARNLAKIIATKDDHFIALGWCTLVRGLVDYESATDQYPMNGIRQRHNDLLKIFSSCISHLTGIISKGSALQDGFELPSRLAVSAADCILVLSEYLTKVVGVPSNRQKISEVSTSRNRQVTQLATGSDKNASIANKSSEVSNKEMEYLLWDHLEEIRRLVDKLLAWSRKSRPLHVKGLEQVLKWLQEIKGLSDDLQDGSIRTGVLLLASCWKHYSMLLRMEDHKASHGYEELLEQYLLGLQFYTKNHAGGHSENKDSGIGTRKFFLSCLCLLLGRFDRKRLESMVAENGMRISHVILPQLCGVDELDDFHLHCVDEDVIEGVVCILKAIIFKPHISSESSHADNREADAVLPLLINLLDEQDGTARAVIMLLAEYCLTSKDKLCLQEVLKRLASEIVVQRKNAVEVISELIRISSDSTTALSLSSWYNSGLLADPSMILPSLIRLVYSLDQRVQSSASDALVRVLKFHNQSAEVLCMLLDCLGNIHQSLDFQKSTGDVGEGSKLETDQVLKLIPEWSRSVHNWNVLIGPLIDKIFAQPSDATIVRFLSYISRHLAEAADIVLYHVLLHTRGQMDIDESSFSGWEGGTHTSGDYENVQQLLFKHLCPLLIIRMLPLSIFNDLNSSIIYGELINEDYTDIKIFSHECVASLLLKRAFYKFQFEDVRKLAAELCGRVHPKVLIPIVCSQLEHATSSRDLLQIKTCLFSLCTSLVVRGRDSLYQPAMYDVRKLLEKVLLWSSLDGDEVSKAQHGCIDCLALMICANLQASESYKDSTPEKILIVGKQIDSGDSSSRNSVLTYVINELTSDKNEPVSTSQLGGELHAFGVPVPLSFRLCMANVLISACQKISDSGKKPFVKRTLPLLIRSVEAIRESDIRAACIQVLFSSVYHLKSVVCPYASELLKLSLKVLQKGSEKEKMAGAKLMASLMGSEDEILESISGGLVKARSVLSCISSTDPSMELRQICSKLLACITYP
ncbi:Coatomer beta subunit [Parasponia andersonii]|uniref:Coatomer beta subunit n=1 Tax=Parasponia andersonii TaxID=3476 RepID=A0A2P5BKC8_PARAD|nr:Coatomer beta subunit [Parasponia andersonii]